MLVNNSRRRKKGNVPTNNPSSLSYKRLILPQIYRTILKTKINCYIAASNLSPTYGGYMNIALNDVINPFDNSYSGFTLYTSSASGGMNGASSAGSATSNLPMGLAFVSTYYMLYKVMKYRLKVRVSTTTGTDIIRLVVNDFGNQVYPNGRTLSTLSLPILESQPTAKAITSVHGANPPTVNLQGNIAKSLGRRASQWNDIASTSFSGSPTAADCAFAGIYLYPLSGSTNGGAIVLEIELEQYVECSGYFEQSS